MTSFFGQFETIIKSELIGISIRGKRDPRRIVCIYSFINTRNKLIELNGSLKLRWEKWRVGEYWLS